MRSLPTSLALGLTLGLGHAAWAAQELQGPTLPSPQASDPAAIPSTVPGQSAGPGAADKNAVRVELRRLQLEGCKLIACEALLSRLGPLPEQGQTLADIEALAQRVADLYKQAGYPFVQVIVPPQRSTEGVLILRVIEGVLGRATVAGSDPLASGAQPFLDAGLPQGEAIREDRLERTMLLIDDQPGFKLRPVLKPGTTFGESDLLAQIERQNRFSGDVGLDNAGSRSTGAHRFKLSLAANSPFIFGDRVSLNAMSTDQDMWLGSLDYERPLGASGWRGLVGWARTSYQLGGAFASLQASGFAETTNLKISYPLVRSQKANLLGSLTMQHKALQDRYDSVNLVRDKSSDLVILGAQFDRRDAWLGGGVVYGQVSLSAGHVRLDADSRAADDTTARSAGVFSKANLDVARLQVLGGSWTFYARLSAQWTNANLDSSEKYGLGGFLGVRAYPLGEGTGDRGWLGQSELRLSLGEFTPFLLADAGRMSINAKPWSQDSDTGRTLSGVGAGLRWAREGWSVETALAVRAKGQAAQAETPDRPIRAWVSLSRHFE